MPKDSSRQPLPTSSSDFALPPSSSPGASTFSSLDDPNFLFHRIRRPSLLQRSHHSPLSNSTLSFHARRRSQASALAEESESEKERMSTASPSSSEHHTPPLKADGTEEDIQTAKPKPTKTPLTPPRRRSSASIDADMPTIFNRRLNFPLKQPRILKLLAETTKPEEDEVKSEAAFQRLVHSVSELPRTPRPFIDRGRYPEEAGHDEEGHREGTPSDDEVEVDDTPFAFNAPNATQPISIRGRQGRMVTPSGSAANSVAGSVAGSINGDDQTMSISEASSSISMPMDVDMAFGSPLLNSMASMPNHSWRYTPPPTATSAVRNNKRKLDDSRFDPYPTSSKRRAVSPSLHYLNRDTHSTANSPIGRANPSRGPIAIPLTIPTSVINSAASSPTVSGAYPPYPRMMNGTSSPTMRSNSMLLASPIIRPIPRRRAEEEERVVENTGQQVQGLQLGE